MEISRAIGPESQGSFDMTDTEHFEKIDALRKKICTLACPDILAVIREYNRAVEDFRRWAAKNPRSVPAERFRSKSEAVIHKIRWAGDRKIEFVG